MKIAFITSRFPYPTEKGDKLRAFRQLCWLAGRHEVHLFAISHQHVPERDLNVLREICAGVEVYEISRARLVWNLVSGWVSGLPASVAYFLDSVQKRKMQEAIIRLQPQHLYVQLIRSAEYVRALPIDKTLDYMDVFSLGAKQRARSGSWVYRPFFALEAQRLRRYETEVYGDFTHHTIISAQDRDRLPLPYQGSVNVISNGVDTSFFSRQPDIRIEYDVIFVGNLGYGPNIEAAEFLVREIMPLVWKQFPDATVGLSGARPHRRVLNLRSRRVPVTGWVEDIRTAYAKGRIFVAPMFSGLGQQNKILEAMAMQLPCVTTKMTENAIGAATAGALLIAEDAQDFAGAICGLLCQPKQAASLAVSARRFVTEHYQWASKNILLENLLTQQHTVKQSEPAQV